MPFESLDALVEQHAQMGGGLAAVRDAVVRFNGRIDAWSSPGKGTGFPAARCRGPGTTPRRSETQTRRPGPGLPAAAVPVSESSPEARGRSMVRSMASAPSGGRVNRLTTTVAASPAAKAGISS